MSGALSLMFLFALAFTPVQCLVSERHISAVRCADISIPWCQGTTLPATISCCRTVASPPPLTEGCAALTCRVPPGPTPGQVYIVECARL